MRWRSRGETNLQIFFSSVFSQIKLFMSNKVIYEPNQYAKIGFFKTMLTVIKNTAASKELILQLYRRDFLMQYKKSFLG